MGLDQWLYVAEVKNTKCPEVTNETPKVEVGYWRKANMVQKFFNDRIKGYVQNCEYHIIPRKDIRELERRCKRIINVYEKVKAKKIKQDLDYPGYGLEQLDPKVQSVAKKLLPTQDGFFFGSTDFDECYIFDIRCTLEICQEALSLVAPRSKSRVIVYHAWW